MIFFKKLQTFGCGPASRVVQFPESKPAHAAPRAAVALRKDKYGKIRPKRCLPPVPGGEGLPGAPPQLDEVAAGKQIL